MANLKKTTRRRNALQRLETQLESGKKTEKGSKQVDLSDADKKRIAKEADKLKSLT